MSEELGRRQVAEDFRNCLRAFSYNTTEAMKVIKVLDKAMLR